MVAHLIGMRTIIKPILISDDPRDQIGEINREIFGPKEAKTTTIHGVKHQPGKTIYQSVKDMEENDDGIEIKECIHINAY